MRFSRLGQRRQSCDSAPPEDELRGIHEFKTFIEEVKNKNPHLASTPGALHQYAVELWMAKTNNEQRPQKCTASRRESDQTINIFNGMFSKLRGGKNNRNTAVEDEDIGLEDSENSTRRTCAFGIDSQAPSESDTENGRKRSIAPRKSVAMSESMQLGICEMLGDDDDNSTAGDASISSLQNSLDGIEQMIEEICPATDAKRRSSLSGVKEDQVLNFSDLVLDALGKKKISSGIDEMTQSEHESSKASGQATGLERVRSVSDFLPDEIKCMVKSSAFENCKNAHINSDSNSDEKKEGAATAHRRANTHRTSENGVSFSSSDSEGNFKGDFSAWRQSFRKSILSKSPSIRENDLYFEDTANDEGSITSDRRKSIKSLSSFLSLDEANFAGDFSAWRKSCRSSES